MDPALMQMQIKNNASDLQDYLKGLESWEEDMKEKDAALSKHKSILKETLPPIRGSSRKKETKKKKSKPVNQKQERIKSYDFKAWDKFDVEEACEAVDYEVIEGSSSSEGDEDQAEDLRKQQAVYEKEKGNELFKKGRYEEAVECYSRATQLDPLNPIMPANRAMALIKLERYATAESDCSQALTLDPSYLKAYLRRGTARLRLGRTEEAQEDFSAALKLEPGNKLARTELDKLNKEQEKKFVRPIDRPPHLRSKRPLKRITIEDIGGDSTEDHPPPSTDHTPQVTNTTCDTSGLYKPNENKTTNDSATNTHSQVIDIKTSRVDSQFTGNATEQANLTASDTDTSRHPVLIETLDSKESSSVQQCHANIATDHSASSKMKVLSVDSDTCGNQEVKSIVGVVKLPPVPENSITFQADWKRLRRERKLLGEYFKSLPVTQYPALLRQSLETNVFSDIITILLEDYVKCGRSCLNELQALTTVNRFTVATMFLSGRDKINLKEIFNYLQRLVTEQKDITLMKTLLAKYS